MSGPFDIRTVPKPWGHETIWALTDRYCGKILHIKAGEALSVQYHNVKDETVHLLSGHLLYRVQIDEVLTDVHLKEGQSYRITPGTIHQMEAVTDCDVLEVSTPDLDDVVRITDKYGRQRPVTGRGIPAGGVGHPRRSAATTVVSALPAGRRDRFRDTGRIRPKVGGPRRWNGKCDGVM
jgi:mannose-6-phosphate isomerase-like protein (cupin superfamily)